jgi:hypothetical protein
MNIDPALHDEFVKHGVEVAVQVVARKSITDPQHYRALIYKARYPGQVNLIAEPLCVGDEATTESASAQSALDKYLRLEKPVDGMTAAQETIASLQAELERVKAEAAKPADKPADKQKK